MIYSAGCTSQRTKEQEPKSGDRSLAMLSRGNYCYYESREEFFRYTNSYFAKTNQLQIDICTPTPETLYGDIPSKVLCIGSSKWQSVT